MDLKDLWLPRIEIKKPFPGVPYPECNLLVVIVNASVSTARHSIALLDYLLDVSDPYALALTGLVYSRTMKHGGVVDVECWSGMENKTRDEICSALVVRPKTIVLLITDVNKDDPAQTKKIMQAAKLMPNTTLHTLCVMPKPFASHQTPYVFNVLPLDQWSKSKVTAESHAGDEVDFMHLMRQQIYQGLLGSHDRLPSRSPMPIDTDDSSESIDSSYIPQRVQSNKVADRQDSMNKEAFEKYRKIRSGESTCASATKTLR